MSLSRATIYHLFKKLEGRASDAPWESLQRPMMPEVVNELVEIVALIARQHIVRSSLTVGIAQLWNGWKSLVIRTRGQLGYATT